MGGNGDGERERAAQPEDLGRLFSARVNVGDVDGLVALYEPDAALAGTPGGVVTERAAIRRVFEEHAPRDGARSLRGGRQAHRAYAAVAAGVLVALGATAIATYPAGAAPRAAPITPGTRGGTVTRMARDSGVTFAFSTQAGPYFLGEMLAVTATIINRSHAAIAYAGVPRNALCLSTMIAARGGAAPFFPDPTRDGSCPYTGGGTTALAPGARLTSTFAVPLIASGGVTGGRGQRPLFAAGLPALSIHVQAQVPARRSLRLIPAGCVLIVRGDAATMPPLFVAHVVAYVNAGSLSPWLSLQGDRIRAPQSMIDGGHELWTVFVGAGGYRIAIGRYHSIPLR